MERDSVKKYFAIGLTAFCVIVGSILFFFSLFRIDQILYFLNLVLKSLMPFVYGLTLAYLLNPIFNYVFEKLFPFFTKRMKNPKKAKLLTKCLSTTVSIILAVVVVVGLVWLVLPQVITSIIGLIESNVIGTGLQSLMAWVQTLLIDNPELESMVQQVYQEAFVFVTSWLKTDMLPQLTNLMSGLLSTLAFIKNIFIGVIIAIYVLNSKELFSAQAKKMVYSIFPLPRANLVIDNMRYTHRVFGGFINGKLLDSFIIGIICFVGLSILNMPYAMLISVVIGVTNVIPFFGPFIGAIPTGILVLLVDPFKIIYFLIFILALQQFDGNILGPKILGDSTGLSSFWVMFAILLAGGLFGFVGMIVGVPIFAVIYSIIAALINLSLKKKGLSQETNAYGDLNYINTKTNEFVPILGNKKAAIKNSTVNVSPKDSEE